MYCPICLSKVRPDMYSAICECPFCDSVFEEDEAISQEEYDNVGWPRFQIKIRLARMPFKAIKN